jgi:membrane protein YqaA with SNARE-associated domain
VFFEKLYDRVLTWSAHRRAPAYLAVLSAAESSFFPIPPDVMLAPMCLARPRRGWFFAGLCTACSVAGGLVGYLIGRLAFAWIEPWIAASPYAATFDQAVAEFDTHGFWYILLAGFTPIPYKVFTISAGVVGMPVVPFVAGSTAGRGARFFLVAGLLRLGGEDFAARLRRWVDLLGWLTLLAAAVAFAAIRLGGGAS